MHKKLTISMVCQGERHADLGHAVLRAITAGLLLVAVPLTSPTHAEEFIYKENVDICKKPHYDYYRGKSWTPCSLVSPFNGCLKDGCCCVSPDSEKCKKSKDIIDGKAKCEPFVK